MLAEEPVAYMICQKGPYKAKVSNILLCTYLIVPILTSNRGLSSFLETSIG